MDIYKPRQERQKAPAKPARGKKPRPRGAVLSAKELGSSTDLGLRKRCYDVFVSLARILRVNQVYLLASVALLALLGLFAGFNQLKQEMPIEKVFVKGDFYQIKKSEVEATLAPLVGSNYLDVNIKEIKQSLMKFAWVQSIEVRKIWPASIEVKVRENKAIAMWGGDGFVNEYGKVFKPETVNKVFLKGLPDLHGSDQDSDLVLSTYVSLSELSSLSDFKITSFSLIANNFWELEFANGIELVMAKGREQQSLKVFLAAYNKELKYSNKALARVDMRYSNGFSAQFHDEDTLAEQEKTSDIKSSAALDIESINTTKTFFDPSTSIEKLGKHHG